MLLEGRRLSIRLARAQSAAPLLEVSGRLDHTGAVPHDVISVVADGFRLPQFNLPGIPLALAAGSGASRLRFELRGDSIAARSARLVVTLQNGPDAVRLVQQGRVLDRVGYGALNDPGFYEGRPALDDPDASLARIPDGRDSDDNAADFQAARPSPGRRNAPQREWRVSLAEPDWIHLWPGRRLSVTAQVHNSGLETLEAGAWQARAELFPLPQWTRDTLPQQKLADFVFTLLRRMVSPAGSKWEGELLLREIAHPTEACQELVHDYIRPNFEALGRILEELMPDATPEKRHLVGFSIVGQCLHYRVTAPVTRMLVSEGEFSRYQPEKLAEHITEFTLRGIGATQ